MGSIIWSTTKVVADARRRRASHDDALALVARAARIPGVRIIDDDQAAVYCVPGRRRIVLTTGALRCLDSRQLDAVLVLAAPVLALLVITRCPSARYALSW